MLTQEDNREFRVLCVTCVFVFACACVHVHVSQCVSWCTTLPCRETAHRDSLPLGSSLICHPPQLMSLKGSVSWNDCDGICLHAHTNTHTHTHTHRGKHKEHKESRHTVLRQCQRVLLRRGQTHTHSSLPTLAQLSLDLYLR